MSAIRHIRRWPVAFGVVAALYISTSAWANPKGGVSTTELKLGYREHVHLDFTPSIGGREYGFRIREYSSLFEGLLGYDPAKLKDPNGIYCEFLCYYKPFDKAGWIRGIKLIKLLPLLLIFVSAITGWIVLNWKRKRSQPPQ